jgi:hypothetical protein
MMRSWIGYGLAVPALSAVAYLVVSTSPAAAPANAADLPKEGQVDVTYSGAGSLKTMPLGKEKSFFLFEENGLSVGEGLLDHMTWHCWGVGDGINTVIAFRGNCIGTDPAGDQLAIEFAADKADLAKPPYTFPNKLIGGTGKYAGISGGWTTIHHGPEFKTPDGSQLASYAQLKGSYKLP